MSQVARIRERAETMLAEARADGRPAGHWRVSADVHRALRLGVQRWADGDALVDGEPADGRWHGDRMLGLPLIADGTLPPNSMLLEAEPAGRRGEP